MKGEKWPLRLESFKSAIPGGELYLHKDVKNVCFHYPDDPIFGADPKLVYVRRRF